MPLIGQCERDCRAFCKSSPSGEAETIVHPPRERRRLQRAERSQRIRDRERVTLELRPQVLDEVHLVDVTLVDRSPHGLDRRRVLALAPGRVPLTRRERALRLPRRVEGVGDRRQPARLRPGRRAGAIGDEDPRHVEPLPRQRRLELGERRELNRRHDGSCHSSLRMSGTAVPSASTASTSSYGPPTMKSTWMLRLVHVLVRLAVEAVLEPGAERDVARRVLVEERVVEERPGLADARLAGDERELAEPVGVLDARDLRPDELRAGLGIDVDDPPVLEA